METVKRNEHDFEAWLSAVGLPHLTFPRDESAFYYGDREKSLKPPKKHLEKLIDYMAKKAHRDVKGLSPKRRALFGLGSDADREAARVEARRLLDQTYGNPTLPKAWYIFEGETCPDIYVEGDDYVIVCEGKWTEPNITAKTTHLCGADEYRHQMIRHIQGALNITDKRVYAFYIVDADCAYRDALTPEALREQIALETVTPERREEILASFCGYTTWQGLKSLIPSLSFMRRDEIDAARSTCSAPSRGNAG